MKIKETTPPVARTFQLEMSEHELDSIIDGLILARARYDHKPDSRVYRDIVAMIRNMTDARDGASNG